MSIYGFMHIGAMNNWAKIFRSQLRLLSLSGLLQATESVYICGTGKLYKVDNTLIGESNGCKNHINFSSKKFILGCLNPVLEDGEIQTMLFIQKMSTKLLGDKFWYIHTKGARWGDKMCWESSCAATWRNYMEYFIVERWQDCQLKLENYDVCGVELESKKGMLLFAGNFWWANANYIARIKNPICEADENPYEQYGKRFRAEFFICRGNPKAYNLHSLGVGGRNLYGRYIYRNLYTSDVPLVKIKLL